MTNNLKLWNSVEKTDPKYTKPVTLNNRTFTSISPMYQKKSATDAFGPQGIDWGVVNGSEQYNYKELGTTTLLIYTAVLFFHFDGKKGELPIAATEKLSYVTKGGKGYLKIDEDADKKVRTNALTKGLSELGFNADIFMGLFEDNEYKAMRELEEKLSHSENFEQDQKKGFDEVLTWLNREITAIAMIKNQNSITLVTNNVESKLRTKMEILKSSPEKLQKYITKLHSSSQLSIDKLNQEAA